VPNWFGVAIPDPDHFDLSSDVHVIIYFHPTPGQAGYNSTVDYPTKTDANGTDWKQLFAYIDRLGGQMAAAIQQYGAPANRLVIFPFLTEPPEGVLQPSQGYSQPPQYSLQTSEWGNIIHDILQDINTNWVNGICTRPKNVILATTSDGSTYLNQFLNISSSDQQSGADSILPNIIEIWDFDSDIATAAPGPVDPQGIHLRAYWQNADGGIPAGTDFVQLPPPPASTWINFPPPPPEPPTEVPPLPPNPSNSNSVRDPGPPYTPEGLYHHYIRDTMFLDAVWNLANPNA
jgi:hypothetical protein